MGLETLGKVCSHFDVTLDRALGSSSIADLIRREGFDERPETFERLLKLYGMGNSCDVRDRIYSLISLASDQKRLSKLVPVDYSQSAPFLFWQMMGYLILIGGQLVVACNKSISSILEADEQTTCSIPRWSRIEYSLGYVICGDFLLKFIKLAKDAREALARSQAGIRSQRPWTSNSIHPTSDRSAMPARSKSFIITNNEGKTPLFKQQHQGKDPNYNQLGNTARQETSTTGPRPRLGKLREQHVPIIKENSPLWLRSLRQRLDQDDWFYSLDWFNFMSKGLDDANVDSIYDAKIQNNVRYSMECIMNTLTKKVEEMEGYCM
jgi:hypothetical protein